jgi:hypothetical protein
MNPYSFESCVPISTTVQDSIHFLDSTLFGELLYVSPDHNFATFVDRSKTQLDAFNLETGEINSVFTSQADLNRASNRHLFPVDLTTLVAIIEVPNNQDQIVRTSVFEINYETRRIFPTQGWVNLTEKCSNIGFVYYLSVLTRFCRHIFRSENRVFFVYNVWLK